VGPQGQQGRQDRLVIWCNAELSETARALLREGTREHRLVVPPAGLVAPSGSGVPDAGLVEADVAYGQPSAAQLLATPRLRWLHLSSAGYAPYDRPDVRAALRAQGALLSKSSLVYDEPCAEHAIAFLLAHERRLPEAFANAHGARAWPQHALRGRARLLDGRKVVVVGFGAIGRRLVELLEPFGVVVAGIRRRVTGDELVPTFAWDSPEAARALAEADHVIDVLPGTAETHHAFDAARLAALKPGAVLINIGRGTTVDQDALVAALASGRLAAAISTSPTPSRCRPTTRSGRRPTASSRRTSRAATRTRPSAPSATSSPTSRASPPAAGSSMR